MRLSTRIAVLTAVVIVLGGCAIGWSAAVVARTDSLDSVDRSLDSAIEEVRADQSGDPFFVASIAERSSYSLAARLIFDDSDPVDIVPQNLANSTPLLGSVTIKETIEAEDSTLPMTVGGASVRIRSLSLGDGSWLVVGTSVESIESRFRDTLGRTVQTSLVIALLLSIIVYVVVVRLLRPLRALTIGASRLASENVELEPLPSRSPREIRDLNDSLSTMLSNIREAIDARMRSEDRMRKFLGDTAHELRTPLTVIRGYVDILKQHGEVPADVTERALRRLDSESDRMGRILDDLLLLAKLDEVGVRPEESVDVQAIISELAADLRSRNPHRSVGMNLEGLESISGDADHIERLFVNIFANIERHTPEDAPVLVSSKSTADGTSIVIEDGGPGMSESMMTRLSSGNVRFDSDRNRAHGGVGLGVSIIHSIVREHGGTATYSASILGGTKIEIWFPRQRANYIPAYVR